MPVLKNTRWEAFAQARAKGSTIDDAYVAAGFKANRSNAARLNSNEHVAGRVAELTERTANRAEIDIERTLREFVRLGLSDIRGLVGPDGNVLPPSQWSDEAAATVASLEVIEKPAGTDEDGNPLVERTYKVRQWSKTDALDKIAKHLGMFIERAEVNVIHHVADLNDEELDREIEQTLTAEQPAMH